MDEYRQDDSCRPSRSQKHGGDALSTTSRPSGGLAATRVSRTILLRSMNRSGPLLLRDLLALELELRKGRGERPQSAEFAVRGSQTTWR